MYLLDANVFISAKNAHYGMDFVPAFWDWIDDAHRTGLVSTVDAVGQEIKSGGDELAVWAKLRPGAFYRAVDNAALAQLQALATWAQQHQNYTAAAKSTFLQSADYYLVAQAKALDYTVVTHEKSEPQAKKIVKIPDACIALGVRYVQPWRMLRDEKARFVL